MKSEVAKIEVTARLLLSARDLELLNNFLSYDGLSAYVKSIAPNSYEGGVSLEEMRSFVESLKATVETAKDNVNEMVKKGLIR